MNKLTFPDIPVLPLQSLRKLPQLRPQMNMCGVYFLFAGEHSGNLVHVGQSRRCGSRLLAHEGRSFTRATVLSVDWPFQLAVEAIYVDAYRPVWNVQGNGGGAMVIASRTSAFDDAPMPTTALIPIRQPELMKAAGIPWNENAARWAYRNRKETQLESAFVNIGRRIFVDPVKFHALARGRRS